MDAASDEYRRRARRLRWQLRDRPGDMQRELGKLAAGKRKTDRTDRQECLSYPRVQRMTDKKVYPTSRAGEVVFIDAVRQRLDGKVLRYTCREELLRLAGELGIGRFEANLLIASTQHQASAGVKRSLPLRRREFSRIAMASAALVLQSAVLLGLWLIFR